MRWQRAARAATLVFLLSAPVAWPGVAAAADGESALSLSLAYGTYTLDGYNPQGTVLGVDFERGFSDALSWRIAGGVGGYYRDGATFSGHVVAGFTYLFDVLKYVPYLEAGAGGVIIVGGDRDTELAPLLQVGVGLDVLLDRESSWGVFARFERFVESTAVFTAGARYTWRWGYF
ncbi:hypothetical protein [Haliangium sp.]|uniref:hypothetical protein n=1 Tax=Haliangium sp. TaxID=2663208 RepID=UPI003D13E15B